MPKIVDHDLRRVELARAVLAVVERDGVNAASVRAVAAEAGWTYGMIAHYFKRRDDLLLFAYRMAIERELERAPTAADEADPFERLIGVLKRTLPVDETAALDLRIWLGFLGRVADDPSLAQAVLREHEQCYDEVRELVKECDRAGLLLTEHDPIMVAEMITTFIDGLGIAATFDQAKSSPEYLDRTLRTYLSALGLVARSSARR